MANLQSFPAYNKVNRLLDYGRLLIIIFRHIIRLLVMLDYRLGLLAEDIDIVVANQLVNLYICTVGSAQRHRAV